jgi:hypothetical protein
MSAVLLAHSGTTKLNRDELKAIPTPEGTNTHQPVSHYQIIDALLETLSFRHISVKRDEYAVSPDGMKMFGVLDLETEYRGVSFSIGIRNANDKSMSTQTGRRLRLARSCRESTNLILTSHFSSPEVAHSGSHERLSARLRV